MLPDPPDTFIHRGSQFGHEPVELWIAHLGHTLRPGTRHSRHCVLDHAPDSGVDHPRWIPGIGQRPCRHRQTQHLAAVEPGGFRIAQ
jgi:hypothetical protein